MADSIENYLPFFVTRRANRYEKRLVLFYFIAKELDNVFSDSPQLKAMERLMTAAPRFHPKGGGVMVCHDFEYTAEMWDCHLCLYFGRKEKCTISQCPCIEERIIAGAADREEVMAETMKNIQNAAFRRRLNQFIRESEELHILNDPSLAYTDTVGSGMTM